MPALSRPSGRLRAWSARDFCMACSAGMPSSIQDCAYVSMLVRRQTMNSSAVISLATTPSGSAGAAGPRSLSMLRLRSV